MTIFNATIKVMSDRSILLLSLLFFTQLNYAQSYNPSSLILGTWMVDRAACMAAISDEDRALLNTSQDSYNKIQQGLTNRTFTFDREGNFAQIDGFANRMGGHWQLQGQTLIITSPSGGNWTQQIVELTQNRLVLEQAPKGEGQPIVPILYLIKI